MTKELMRPLPRTWWLRKQNYLVFMIRELTSLAVLAYAVLLIGIMLVASDEASFSGLFDFLDSTTGVVIHVGLFVFAMFHTITWIALTPKVLVLWRGDEQIESDVIAGANSILFLVVSGGLLWVVLG